METLSTGDLVHRERIPYQAVLRSLGAYLDDLAPQRIRVIETGEGFDVQMTEKVGDPTLIGHCFRHEDLLAPGGFLARLRRKRYGGTIVALSRRYTYQDLLRALGYELEEASAYAILIDEVDAGFLVTYQYFDAATGFMPRKHMVFLGADGIHLLLESARSRRRHGKRFLHLRAG